jgi:hypothetical protein
MFGIGTIKYRNDLFLSRNPIDRSILIPLGFLKTSIAPGYLKIGIYLINLKVLILGKAMKDLEIEDDNSTLDP